ncbi:MAG: hypothetical protein Q9204_003946 [Flavoplaca sp. TL-2023a]
MFNHHPHTSTHPAPFPPNPSDPPPVKKKTPTLGSAHKTAKKPHRNRPIRILIHRPRKNRFSNKVIERFSDSPPEQATRGSTKKKKKAAEKTEQTNNGKRGDSPASTKNTHNSTLSLSSFSAHKPMSPRSNVVTAIPHKLTTRLPNRSSNAPNTVPNRLGQLADGKEDRAGARGRPIERAFDEEREDTVDAGEKHGMG